MERLWKAFSDILTLVAMVAMFLNATIHYYRGSIDRAIYWLIFVAILFLATILVEVSEVRRKR